MACGINNGGGGCGGAGGAGQYAGAAGQYAGAGGGMNVAARAANGGGGDAIDGGLQGLYDKIMSDGKEHGFTSFEDFKEKLVNAVTVLKEKGIITADDLPGQLQQMQTWLQENAGTDGVFSFGGGGNGENDAARIFDQLGIEQGVTNSIKFLFDSSPEANAQLDENDLYYNDIDALIGSQVYADLEGLI